MGDDLTYDEAVEFLERAGGVVKEELTLELLREALAGVQILHDELEQLKMRVAIAESNKCTHNQTYGANTTPWSKQHPPYTVNRPTWYSNTARNSFSSCVQT